jgi:histone RNA hairpin-binding protein
VAGGTGALTVAALGEETDPHRLRQRQKQVDYGKNTLGYDRYMQLVPKERRRRTDPRTPDIHARISTKRFNGLVRAWRRRLHEFDPQDGTAAGVSSSSSSSSPSSISAAPRAGVPSYAAVVKTPGSSSHSHNRNTPNRGGGGGGSMQNRPVSNDDDDSSSDGEEGEEIIITQQGGPGSTGGKGRDKKKSRVSPYYRAAAGEAAEEAMDSGCVENDFPALASAGAAVADGEQAARRGMGEEGGEGDFYEIKRSTAMGAGIGGACSSGSSKSAGCARGQQVEDEELCYSDDDLL